MTNPKTVNWYEHPRIIEINNFVEREFKNNKAFLDEYYKQGESSFKSFKEEMDIFITEWLSKLSDLNALVGQLPDDTKSEYDIEWKEV